MFIYKITNKINNKSYIGKTNKTIKERYKRHLICASIKINRYLYDAMNHYGIDNFIIEEIEKCNLKESDDREIFYIKKYNTYMPNGYNMTYGGGGGDTLSNHPNKIEIFKKQGEKRKGIKKTKECINKMKIGWKIWWNNLNKQEKDRLAKQTSDTNKKLGIRPPEKYISKPGCIGFFKGKKHKKSSKKSMSIFRKGKKYEDIYSLETIKKIKNIQRENFLNEKNPRYVCFSNEKKLKFLNLLLNDLYIKLYDCEKILKISKYKIRIFLRENNIKNLKKFRAFKEQEQIKKIKEIKNVIENG